MATAPINPADVAADDYLAIGLATCFVKQEGEVEEIQVIEPIPSAALEALMKEIPTSYQRVCGIKFGEILSGETLQRPADFPAQAHFCQDFVERAIAAARTYKSRPSAQSLIPVGTTRTDFNFSTERKRVLNAAAVVRPEDNVKQHEYTHKVL